MPLLHNLNFPPVYQRLRNRALAMLPLAFVVILSRPVFDIAARTFDLQREPLQIISDSACILLLLPMSFYLGKMGIIKYRAIYAKSPLCPLCAAKMVAPDPAAASATGPSTPADPAALFTCPRWHHAATRAELKAAWSDVT